MTLHADAPISTGHEDLLGYRPFAVALARSLAERPPGEGFVVGVQARWGMGKSSAINLVTEALREREAANPSTPATRVLIFNPWLFAGVEALARSYLAQLGRLIAEEIGDGAPEGTRNFVNLLVRGGAEMVGGAAALAVGAAGGAALAMPVKAAVTGALAMGAGHLEGRSLDEEIAALRTHLETVETRFLMIVDDLDRLQPEELRQVLTLIKTFGNLPRVVHPLAYDRRILDHALGHVEPAPGVRVPRYL